MKDKFALVIVITFVCVAIAVSFGGGLQNERDLSAQLGGSPSPTPSPGLSGTVTYGNAIGDPNPRFISRVIINCQGVLYSATGNDFPSGYYWLDASRIGPGPYTVTPSKTDGVNGISTVDATKVARYAVGLEPPLPDNQLIVADVSGDGFITSFDASLIARYVVHLPNSGLTGTWKFIPANRNYETINTYIGGQDYVGLLMGDVSGDWINTLPPPVTPTPLQ